MGATYKPNVNLNNLKSTREMFMPSSQSTYKEEDFMTIQITGNAKELAALIKELQGQENANNNTQDVEQFFEELILCQEKVQIKNDFFPSCQHT